MGAFVVSIVWTLWLTGEGIWGAHTVPAGAFHPSHAFFAWHLSTVPLGGVLTAPPFGWPEAPGAQLIGWVPLSVAALAQTLGPMRAYGVALLVGPLLTVWATWAWLSRIVPGRPDARALATLAFVSCSFGVAALGNGQLAKVQLWVLPAVLWSVAAARSEPSLPRVGVVVAMTVAGVLTAPSLAVQLPVAAVVQVALRTPPSTGWTREGIRSSVVALMAVAVGLLPGVLYVQADAGNGTRPAVAGTGTRVGGAAPSASLEDLLFGTGARSDGLDAVNHAPVLGGALLLLAGWLVWRRPRVTRTGGALLLVGALLALGPELRWGADPVELAGWTVGLPASWLAALGYPMGQTGQWYRFVALGSLGLCAVVAGAHSRRQVLLLAGAVVLSAVQAVHQSGHPFPRAAVPIPAAESMARLRLGGPAGAVVVLPLIASTADGGPGLAMGALAGRHTSAMARHTQDHPATTALRALLQRAHAAHTTEAAEQVLAEAGVAVVVWRPGATVMRGEVWLDVDAVAADLGPPELDGDAAVWWIDGRP